MINRNLLFIFLALLTLAACSQPPPADSVSAPADEAVAPLPPAESANQPAGEEDIPPSSATDQPPPVSMGVPLPPSEDFGVNCFVEFGDSIVAGAPNFHTYRSTDGGLTWEELPDSSPLGGSDCSSRKGSWELWASPDGTTRYQFDPGSAVLFSADSGASWENILDLDGIIWQPLNTPEPGTDTVVQPGPLDAMIDPASGNLLLAMGHAGVLLRLPGGEWQWVEAGRYYHGDLSSIRAETAGLKAQQSSSYPEVIPLPPDTIIKAHKNMTTSLLFSPGGDNLASSGYDGGIKLFTFPSGELQRWQQWGKDRSDSTIYGAAFSPDGGTLATCGTNVDKTLYFWDVSNWKLIEKYAGFQTGVMSSTAFSGRQVLAIAYGEDPNPKNQVKIFDMPTGELQSTLTTQLGEITSLRFLPGSSLLIFGSYSSGVEGWDSATGEMVLTFQPNQPPDDRAAFYRNVYSAGYHPVKDAVMAVFGDGSLKAWNASTGEPAWSLSLPAPHGGIASSAALSPDGQLAALGFQNGPLMLFDTLDGRALSRQWTVDDGTLMELAFSPDSQWLAAGYASGDVKIWQVSRLVE